LRSRVSPLPLVALAIVLSAAPVNAVTQLLLSRETRPEGEFKGVVDLVVSPGFDDATVQVVMDGQKVADALRAPYRVPIDLGATAIEHKIVITALTKDKKRIQWRETINRGHLALTIHVRAIDVASRSFEAITTAPQNDPIVAVELWDGGKSIGIVKSEPYRFIVPAENFLGQVVQVTARTKSGEEAADFWAATGDVHFESVDVRTVPIFVSVVDRDGITRDDVDKSLFRILDNGTEAKIIDFNKAFDQPISIALVLDASSSMVYSMDDATKAAIGFVNRTLKQKDRYTVFTVRDTPRREIAITEDREAVLKAIAAIRPQGRTSLFDSIASAIRELKDEKNRRAVVVLTDGGDTSSIRSFDEIDRLAQESGVPLYFIAYDSGAPADKADLDRLTYLAGQTGGFVATASAQNLQAKYGDIEKDLRAQYAIRYQITDFAKRNEWRKIRVVLNSPKLTARTIKGYFAP
jgi:VWFA-related protein